MASEHVEEVVQPETRKEHADRINEHHNSQPDWRGTCQYCKQAIMGTVKQLLEHSCPEFEATK